MIDKIEYTNLINRAMISVVRSALMVVQKNNGKLPSKHHFFITFAVDNPMVVVSEALQSQHPHELTIVLQYQFKNLKVEEDHFSVTLMFNSIPENLKIPFESILYFSDPSVGFELHFKIGTSIRKKIDNILSEIDRIGIFSKGSESEENTSKKGIMKTNNVLSLAKYRKNLEDDE